MTNFQYQCHYNLSSRYLRPLGCRENCLTARLNVSAALKTFHNNYSKGYEAEANFNFQITWCRVISIHNSSCPGTIKKTHCISIDYSTYVTNSINLIGFHNSVTWIKPPQKVYAMPLPMIDATVGISPRGADQDPIS